MGQVTSEFFLLRAWARQVHSYRQATSLDSSLYSALPNAPSPVHHPSSYILPPTSSCSPLSPSPPVPPTMTPSHQRPQTSKAARKAYRKSGATVRLSASELAVIERRAVLQERADRIKERELRRKANIRKKEERNQRERDARQRMGIPSPVDNTKGIRMGPSQLHLGDFIGLGKRKRDEETGEEKDAGDREAEYGDLPGMGLRGYQMSPRPWRNPLQILSANPINQPKPSSSATKALGSSSAKAVSPLARNDASMGPPPSRDLSRLKNPSPIDKRHSLPATKEDEGSTNEQTRVDELQPISNEAMLLHGQGQTKPIGSNAKHDVLAKGKDDEVAEVERLKSTEYQMLPMGPPHLPKALQARPRNTTAYQKPSLLSPQHRPPSTVDDNWDDFFVSNTQISRELSPPPIKRESIPAPALKPNPPASTPAPPSQKENAADLLEMLCTQDLDFSGILTQVAPLILKQDTDDLLAQISTQDLDFSGALTQAVPLPKPEDFDPDEDSTEDLEELQEASKTATECYGYDEDMTDEEFEQLHAESSAGMDIFEIDDEVTEEDLEDLVLEFELESTCQSHYTSSIKQESVEEAHFAAECDAFDFSTQDLLELES